MANTAAKLGCGLCLFTVIFIAIMIAVSISKLEANEVGLHYNSNTMMLEMNQEYTSGIHVLGPGHYFIKFKTSVLEMEFEGSKSVSARTLDGLQVTIQAKVLYNLVTDRDSLGALYLAFKEEYQPVFEAVTRGIIRDVASEYTAFEFWRARDEITRTMKERTKIRLRDLHCDVSTFLLNNFQLPSRFQQAITETDAQKQEMDKVEFEAQTAITETNAKVRKADNDVQIIGLDANATIQDVNFQATAEKFRLNATVGAEIDAYKNIKSTLQLSNEQLISFVWMDSFKSSTSSSKYVSIPAPGGIGID